jgi:hypothetical protein
VPLCQGYHQLSKTCDLTVEVGRCRKKHPALKDSQPPTSQTVHRSFLGLSQRIQAVHSKIRVYCVTAKRFATQMIRSQTGTLPYGATQCFKHVQKCYIRKYWRYHAAKGAKS